MNHNINLKELWNKQNSTMPDAKAVESSILEFKKKQARKKLLFNIGMIGTAIYLLGMGIYFSRNSIISLTGIMMMSTIIILFVILYNYQQRALEKINPGNNNKIYLKQLILFKQRQTELQTKGISFYFGFLTLGLFLGLYPYISLLSKYLQIFVYALTLGWIAFAWFYLRPRRIAIQNAKTDSLIHQLQSISNQIENEE